MYWQNGGLLDVIFQICFLYLFSSNVQSDLYKGEVTLSYIDQMGGRLKQV